MIITNRSSLLAGLIRTGTVGLSIYIDVLSRALFQQEMCMAMSTECGKTSKMSPFYHFMGKAMGQKNKW